MIESIDSKNGSVVVAHDDFGIPITEADLVAESYMRPADPDAPVLLIPPFSFEGSEEDREDLQLVEVVKRHRKIQHQNGATK